MEQNVHNKLTCLFGYHDYSDKITKDKNGYYVQLCKVCQRNGCEKCSDGTKYWYNYDKEGNCIRIKWDHGLEVCNDYDDEGNRIHEKWSDGYERWRANNGRWVDEKPKNWKYEKHV